MMCYTYVVRKNKTRVLICFTLLFVPASCLSLVGLWMLVSPLDRIFDAPHRLYTIGKVCILAGGLLLVNNKPYPPDEITFVDDKQSKKEEEEEDSLTVNR